MRSVVECSVHYQEGAARFPLVNYLPVALVHEPEWIESASRPSAPQGHGPPSTKRDRIVSVDDDLLPNEIQVAHSARSVLRVVGSPRSLEISGSAGCVGL
jgi:hypothetical protein